MSETKHTPGPWRWQGEDYRGGWGWQMLVGPNGEGLIVGDDGGEPSGHLRAFMPLDPELCVTGLLAEGKVRASPVHVFSEANARLVAAGPQLYEALLVALDRMEELASGVSIPSCGKAIVLAKAAIAKAEGAA